LSFLQPGPEHLFLLSWTVFPYWSFGSLLVPFFSYDPTTLRVAFTVQFLGDDRGSDILPTWPPFSLAYFFSPYLAVNLRSIYFLKLDVARWWDFLRQPGTSLSSSGGCRSVS